MTNLCGVVLARTSHYPMIGDKLPSLRSARQCLGDQARFLKAKLLLWFCAAILLLNILALCLPGSRAYILRSAGRLIVAQQSVATADLVVVAIDANGAGTLEAADLVRRGVSNQVAVFDDPPTSVDREFLRRGIPYEDRGAIYARQLYSLGLQNVRQIPRSTSGSEQEGDILPTWCEEQGYHSVILVTSTDHSRRISRILRRSLRGHRVKITVRPSRYSEFDPDIWWRTREGARIGVVELEKLILDVVRHPFS